MLGQVVSHYRIVRKLGQGGMGEVFEAEDTLLHRAVALKVLPADKVSDADRRARFLTEARAASSLNHPYIVTIHDVVSTEEGAYCIVMERVRGRSLADAIPKDGLPIEEALRYAVQTAEALSAAHSAGIVHRDLKPGNVMITDRGDVKVLDFGLAKLLPAAADADEGATITSGGTQVGLILGTPDYMSPEQAKGEPVDRRTDVFSFGMLLFEMLAGDRPFRRADRIASLHALVTDPAPRVSAVRPEVPAALDAVIDRLLAKDRDARYGDFGEILDALKAIELPQGGTGPSGAAMRSGGRPRAHMLAYGVLASVLIGAAVAWVMWSPSATTGAAPTEAGSAATPAPLPSTASDHVREGERYLARYDRTGYIDQAIAAFQAAMQRQADYPPAYAGLGKAFWRKHRELRDRTFLDYAVSNARQAVERDPLLANGHAVLGLALTALGQLAEASAAFAESLKLDPTNPDALRGLGDLAARREDFASAERQYKAAIAARADDPELPSVLGGLYYRQGRLDEAAVAFSRTIELAEDNFIGHKNLGAVRHMQGRFADAARSLQRAVEIKPDASVYTNLGTLYYYQGLYPQAVKALERSVALSANDYRAWGNLGDAHRRIAGNQKSAAEAYQRAAQLSERELASAPTADVRALRAVYLARGGDAAGARAELARLDTAKSLPAETLYVVALALEALGDRAGALATLARALDAGHSVAEAEQDPELTALRADPRYHRMMISRPPVTR